MARLRDGHPGTVEIDLEDVRPLTFDDGEPVRAASGVAPFGDGFLVVQDDATHAAWLRDGPATRVRLLPPVDGLDSFDEESGTKHLKPDLEAACHLEVAGLPAVLVLGSGSSPRRMRWVLVTDPDDGPATTHADLTPVYAAAADALDVDLDALNLEGASIVGDRIRWYHRGLPSAGDPSGSVDLDLATALAVMLDGADAGELDITHARHYDLGKARGVGLAVTDSVVLPDGRVLVSAAAEDSPNVRDDGPVVGSALVLLDDRLHDRGAVARADLPRVGGEVAKVEGLTLLDVDGDAGAVRLLAVVDGDDPSSPSLVVRLRVSL